MNLILTLMELKQGEPKNCTLHGFRLHQTNPTWCKTTVMIDYKQPHFIYLTTSHGQCRVLVWDHGEPTNWLNPALAQSSLYFSSCFPRASDSAWSLANSTFFVRYPLAVRPCLLNEVGPVLAHFSGLQCRHLYLTYLSRLLALQKVIYFTFLF